MSGNDGRPERGGSLKVWCRRLRHPLSWLPDIPVEQLDAYHRVWDNFQTAPFVEDGSHDTDDWRLRASSFAICCVRVPREGLNDEFSRVRDVLHDYPFVRLHPDGFLHIPIQELGFVSTMPRARDEINLPRLEEFCSVARIPIAESQQFIVNVVGLNSFLDAPFLGIEDGASLSRIQRRLLDITLIPPNTRYPYLPHVTIGHYIEHAPIEDLPAKLAPWKDTVFGTFEVKDIDVVTISTDETYPPLVEFQRLPLGTATATTPFVTSPGMGTASSQHDTAEADAESDLDSDTDSGRRSG